MLQFLYVIVSTIGLLVLTGGGILAQVEIDSIEQIRSSATQAYRLPGTQKDGQVLLPTQWSLNPAGKHLQVGDFPVTIEMHPLESYAAVLHAGYGDHEIVVIELNDFSIVSRVSLPETFVGLRFNSTGDRLYASGAEQEVVHQFTFQKGNLFNHEIIQVVPADQSQVPAGITVSSDDTTLYVACPWGNSVCVLPLDSPTKKQFIKFAPDSFPYFALPDANNQRLYVSLWGKSAIAVVNLANLEIIDNWNTESHPTESLLTQDQQTLYVACANSNCVTVIDTESGKSLEVISSALYPTAANGSTPNSVSLSPDENVLLIANATNNNIAVIDVQHRGHSRSLGFVPVGWYPTCARFGPHDENIYVANGKGLLPKANRHGPNPLSRVPKTVQEYIGGLFQGTISKIEPPSPAEMIDLTQMAFACSPLREDQAPVVTPSESNNPIPAQVGEESPIKYCIYIIKENRTYDQVLGDLPQGNGDPSLCIFPRHVTPNHHALAEQFVLLDNFYVESEVSADGHEWSMAAYATDFVEKTWPLKYRGSREGKLKYPAEGTYEIAQPSSGYIWDKAKAAGVSYRSYGEFISNPVTQGAKATAKVKSLEGHFDPDFHGYDLDYRDVDRAARFLSELERFEREGDMPRLQILRIPNDHTYGTAVGKLTPTAMVADNDLAFGQIVEGLSKSKFWPELAIFVVEDDAQNGSDHVDAHRTIAFAISPYVKRGYVDSSMYSTSSLLRTIELILGMEPMTQFDAAALPMYASFTPELNSATYKHLPAQVNLQERNDQHAFGAQLSATFDFSQEDAADDLLLNEVIWRSVRGPESPMPAPVRAGFVFASIDIDDDDDAEEGDFDGDDFDGDEKSRDGDQQGKPR
ncbi:MAG: beta-propeller fold lactonase family protein [Planctomycetales bacterium]|nr:beta-propeller fold lactonase family protein [Planctomycetales bacterium]